MMKKPVIKETIVVEGKHDEAKIKSVVDADILISNGTHLSKEFIAYAKCIAEKNGIIIFTDPDSPGNQIRNVLRQHIPQAKHAVLVEKQKKVGVEHASKQEILKAIENAQALYTSTREKTLSKEDFIDLHLTGKNNSQTLRNELCKKLHLPIANGKQMFKYLNMLKLTKEDVVKLL